jgi:membrane protein YdbS with pleckstrin-like domain
MRGYHWVAIFSLQGLAVLSSQVGWAVRPSPWMGLAAFVALVVLVFEVQAYHRWRAWQHRQREAYGERWIDQ